MPKIKFEFDHNELTMLYYLIRDDLGDDLTHEEITNAMNDLPFTVKYEIVKFGVYDYRVKDMIIAMMGVN